MAAACTPKDPQPHGNPFQIRLRTLFLVTAIVAVGCWTFSQGIWDVLGHPTVQFDGIRWQASNDGGGIVVLHPNAISVVQPHPGLVRFFDFLYWAALVLTASGLVWGFARLHRVRRQQRQREAETRGA